MRFDATNYTVSIMLLMALTVFIAGVRIRKPVENSWPLFYWVLMTAVTIMNPYDTYDFRLIATGLTAGLLIRFEFMNRHFARIFMFVEMLVWVYVVWISWKIVAR